MFEIMNTITGPLDALCVGGVIILVVMTILGFVEAFVARRKDK